MVKQVKPLEHKEEEKKERVEYKPIEVEPSKSKTSSICLLILGFYLLIPMFPIGIVLILIGLYKLKKVKEKGLEPEIKSKLIISPDLNKSDVIQEDVIPSISEKKPKELELFEEEIVSVQEEIIEEEQVMEETIVPTEKIVEEEQILEETIVPAEEILEEEEKIVKDIIETPKVEIYSCQFCGMELSSDVIYCLRCGHKLKK